MARAPASVTAVAFTLAAGVIAGVVSAGDSSHSRPPPAGSAEFGTVTLTRSLALLNRRLRGAAQPPQTTDPPVTFVPLDVQRFGRKTAIPARWSVRTQSTPTANA